MSKKNGLFVGFLIVLALISAYWIIISDWSGSSNDKVSAQQNDSLKSTEIKSEKIAGNEAKDMDSKSKSSKKILVAYFSHTGNTRVIAEQIRDIAGGDIFEIKPVKDYPTNYNAVVDQAKKEINANFKPELKSKVSNIDDYDVIFVGSPNWWSTIAPPVATFLTTHNLDGKTVVPFMTHGGGGMGHIVPDIKKLCPKSKMLEAFAVNGSMAKSAKSKVSKWLQEIGITK